MLTFPNKDDNFAENIARELSKIESTCPNVMAWLKSEEKRLKTNGAAMIDEVHLRWNQGGLQLLASLFKYVRDSRDIYNNIIKGD